MDPVEPFDRRRRYLEPQGRLKPANAAVALIVDEQGRYLVQLRDSKPNIFFPDHWGCFGGAIEPGETNERCLARELDEELGLDLSLFAVRHFTTFTFDFGFAGGSVIHRAFYELAATRRGAGRSDAARGASEAAFLRSRAAGEAGRSI